ncbi:MAG TPA: response regulator [Bacteroidia bacterium]|nr:response regulator [Bacteroidia bacterium]
MKILLIDDDALVLRSLSHQLAEEGYHVDTAKDGAEAVDYIEKEKTRPDLIICDLLMPGISGLTFISLLRNFHNFSIPVIVISSLDKGYFLSQQAGIPGTDFLPKPVEFSLLSGKIKKYIPKTVQL